MVSDIREKIGAANTEVVNRLAASNLVLGDMLPAGQVVPGLEDRMVQHSGLPVTWQNMCDAQRGAVMAMVVF